MRPQPQAAIRVRWCWQVLVVAFCSFLIGLGIRSMVKDDARYGWAMFGKHVQFDVEYAWVFPNDQVVRYWPGDELRGKARRIDGRRNRVTRYSVGAVQAWIEGYGRYMVKHHAPEHALAFRAQVRYEINKDGHLIEETVAYPVP